MIKNLSFIFGSKTKAQEIVFLMEGAKEVVRQGFYASELPPIEIFCQEKNIFIVKSNFKVILADEETGSYSNKGLRIPEKDKRSGMYFVYLSKEEEKAWLTAYYELMNNHRDLGLILGYPQCCVNFFCSHFQDKKTNLELKPTNPFTNLAQRDRDLVLLSHFPCSPECLESINLGKRYLDLLRKVDPSRAKELVAGLDVNRN